MGGKSDEIKETPSQQALAQYATNMMSDYKQRWLPVQQKLIAQVETMGKEGSSQRNMAQGRTNADTAMQFSQAGGALEKSLNASGAGVGSSRGKLAISGLGQDEAKSRGLGLMVADQQIDDAYTKGLSALAQQGRGERATVSNSMASMASQSAQQAQLDAATALEQRQGNYKVAGQVAGFGLQAAMSGWGKKKGPTPDSRGPYGGADAGDAPVGPYQA